MVAMFNASGRISGKARRWGARLCLVHDRIQASRLLGRAMLDLGYESVDVLQKNPADGVAIRWGGIGGDDVPDDDPFRRAKSEVLARLDPRVHRWVTQQQRIIIQDEFLAQDNMTYTEFMHLPGDFGLTPWQTKLSIPYGGNDAGFSVGLSSTDTFEVHRARLPEVRFLADLYCSLHTVRVEPPRLAGDERPSLHAKQIECLRWVSAGKTYEDIAEIVGISQRTVRYHLENAREKYGFATIMQTVVQAAKHYGFDPMDGR